MNIAPKKNKNDYGENFSPPDGGFGWFICSAGGIANMWIFCVFQNFGLIYRVKLNEIGLSNSQITTIPNTQTAIAYFIGFSTGPLLRRFTFRQVGIVGAISFFLGLIFMSYSDSFWQCILSYGFLVGTGAGLSFPSTAMAINTYFKNKRRIAHSLAWTITGLGQFFMPSLISFLLYYYDVQGASMIIGAICLNMLPCYLIYQPVLWHISKEALRISNFEGRKNSGNAVTNYENKERNSSSEHDIQKIENSNQWYHKIVVFFDLDLLKDPTFVNIIIGMVFPYLAEVNFAILSPFFLNEFGFTQEEIVMTLTLPAVLDIIGRLVLPLTLGKINWSSRIFYMIGVIGQILGIIIIAINQNFAVVLGAFIWFGLCKGLKTVYMQLLLPGYISLNRLSGAIGLNNLLTGIFALVLGPQIGKIRDETNYILVLYVLSFIMTLPLCFWVMEFLFKYCKAYRCSDNKETLNG